MTIDAQNFLSSWKNTPQQSFPYPHYIMKNVFNPDLLQQLRNLPFKAHDLDYKLGRREEFNSFRQYFNPENIEAHESAKRVADIFLSPSVISFIEQAGDICLKDSMLRLEYTMDTEKFWLEPHTDIGEKHFTMVIYLSDDKGAEAWGTDIYCDAETYHSTAPYETNSALIFFPSEKSWHGFRPRHINGIRKTIIVNYVTQAWRSRHELVHPTKTISDYQKERIQS